MGSINASSSPARGRTAAATAFTPEQPEAIAACFRKHGYAVVRGMFSSRETAALAAAAGRAKVRGMEIGRSYRQGNLGYWIDDDERVGPHVIGMQWPSYQEAALEAFNAFSRDPYLARVPVLIIGSAKQQEFFANEARTDDFRKVLLMPFKASTLRNVVNELIALAQKKPGAT